MMGMIRHGQSCGNKAQKHGGESRDGDGVHDCLLLFQ